MKKIAIITAIVLTSAVTAFSLAKKNVKNEVKLEATSAQTTTPAAMSLATAD